MPQLQRGAVPRISITSSLSFGKQKPKELIYVSSNSSRTPDGDSRGGGSVAMLIMHHALPDSSKTSCTSETCDFSREGSGIESNKTLNPKRAAIMKTGASTTHANAPRSIHCPKVCMRYDQEREFSAARNRETLHRPAEASKAQPNFINKGRQPNCAGNTMK